MAESYLSRISQGQQDAFVSCLIASFLAHLLLFGIWNAAPSSSRYAVAQAPASMEIVLVEASSFSGKHSDSEDVPSVRLSGFEEAAVAPFSEAMRVNDDDQRAAAALPAVEKPQNRIPPGAATQAQPLGVLNPAPVYPALARKQGWEGTVIMRVLVQADGLPYQVVVEKSSGHKVLDSAASETIQRWKFQPAGRGARAYDSWITIPVRFALVDE